MCVKGTAGGGAGGGGGGGGLLLVMCCNGTAGGRDAHYGSALATAHTYAYVEIVIYMFKCIYIILIRLQSLHSNIKSIILYIYIYI